LNNRALCRNAARCRAVLARFCQSAVQAGAMEFGADVPDIESLPNLPDIGDGPPAAAPADPFRDSLGLSTEPSHLLGLADPELDDLKEPAKLDIIKKMTGTKRPKLSHGNFFDDDKGLKKVLRTFPKLNFQGKGKEFDDLKLLVRNFDRWFTDLHPYEKNFEDGVWLMRRVLQEKERDDEGLFSEPKERLVHFRHEYKFAPKEVEVPAGKESKLSAEQLRRIEENKKRALAKKVEKESGGASQSFASSSKPAGMTVDDETLWRIEENRQRALKLKEAKKARESAASSSSSMLMPPDMEEDPFGFGFGMDDSAMRAPPVPRTQQAAPAAASSRTIMEDEDEDPFGFGAGFDDEDDGPPPAKKFAVAPAQAPPPQAQAPPPQQFLPEDDEDVFGLGGGFDDDEGFSAPPPPSAANTRTQLESAAPESTAASTRTQLESAAPQSAPANTRTQLESATAMTATVKEGTASTAPVETIAQQQQQQQPPQAVQPGFGGPPDFDEDEDIFGFAGGLDDEPPPSVQPSVEPPLPRPAQPPASSRIRPEEETTIPAATALEKTQPETSLTAKEQSTCAETGTAAATAAPVQTQPETSGKGPLTLDGPLDLDDDDDDPFGFGGGFD